MSILKEKYSLRFIENHLTGIMQKWKKETDMMNTEIRNINGDIQMTERNIKMAGVIQTNPRYIELYNDMQKNMENRRVMVEKTTKAREVIQRISEIKANKKNPYLYSEGTMELSLSDKVLYEIEQDSDLYGV